MDRSITEPPPPTIITVNTIHSNKVLVVSHYLTQLLLESIMFLISDIRVAFNNRKKLLV